MPLKNNFIYKLVNAFFILTISAIGFYFYSEFKTPLKTNDSEPIKELLPPPTPLQQGQKNENTKTKTVGTGSLLYNTDTKDPVAQKMKTHTIEIKPHADLKSLNKENCQKEIFKSALFSYRLKQYSVFGSSLHCISTVLQLSKEEKIGYHQMLGAAGKHLKEYNLNGKTVDLSEENLVKLSK